MQIILTEEEYDKMKNAPTEEIKRQAREILDNMLKQVERNIKSFPGFMQRDMVTPVQEILSEAVRTAKKNIEKL